MSTRHAIAEGEGEPRQPTLPRLRSAARHPVTVTGGSLAGAGGLFLLALQQGWITVNTAPAAGATTTATGPAPIERVVKLEDRAGHVEVAIAEVRATATGADRKADDALKAIGEQRGPLGSLLCAQAGGRPKERRCRWRGRAGVALDDLNGLMDAFDDGR